MKNHVPCYHHLSPSQLQYLSFRVKIRQRSVSGFCSVLSKDVGWQQNISRENDNGLLIYTLTTEDEEIRTLEDTTRHGTTNVLAERIQREDPYETMKIKARLENHDETLSVIKICQSGMVTVCPAMSEGEELYTHSFVTPDNQEYDYTIEMMISPEDCIEESDNSIVSNHCRRLVVHTETDRTEHAFDLQAHVEIVSASGFTEPNILFSAPFGSDLVLRYKILKSGDGGKDDIVLKGCTNIHRNFAILATSMQFLVRFSMASFGVGFVSDTGTVTFLNSLLLS